MNIFAAENLNIMEISQVVAATENWVVCWLSVAKMSFIKQGNKRG
jgi:hypothetical protein